jgi:hypothetical protein
VKLLALAGLVFCFGCGSSSGDKQLSSYATSKWSLVSAYQRAHQEKNVGRALALVNLGRIDTTTRDVLIKNLGEDFQKELVSAELVALDGQEPLEVVINDRRMVPNLKVDKRLHLEFRSLGADGKPQSSTTEYYVGTLNGREMIASAQAAEEPR